RGRIEEAEALKQNDRLQRLEIFEAEALGFSGQLFRVALRVCRDRAQAEDLIQETYLQAWRSFNNFEIGTNLRAWLYKILFNVHYSEARKGRLELAPLEETIMETIAYDPPTPQRLTEEEVLAAIERIPRDFQVPVVLADVEDLSYREIAEVLQIPLGTVMSRLSRGRKLLRMELANYARGAGYQVAD
ncbi:MAG: sigma-70 family RNA polymerase sigma factor, partial [Chloracidobacterium sp.]|nr:sigma-70 family RNA polymerase sigma factor [Chloracidobacterium sp.]